jgi:type I restriction enzyme M protein
MSDVDQKLWGFCHTLRHDGIGYGEYIEQLTFLLFLKMADERRIDLTNVSYQDDKGRKVEIDCSWPALAVKSGSSLTEYYVNMLLALGRQKDLLGAIFAKAVSKFTNPVIHDRYLSRDGGVLLARVSEGTDGVVLARVPTGGVC